MSTSFNHEELLKNAIDIKNPTDDYVKFSVNHDHCWETYPCSHPVLFIKINGDYITKELDSVEIKELYQLNTNNIPEHYNHNYSNEDIFGINDGY